MSIDQDAGELTEVGRIYARLVRRWSVEERRDLARKLDDDLRAEGAKVPPYKRLGLMAGMIVADGLLPESEDYDIAWQQATAAGEDWPDRRALFRAYGSFDAAVSTTVRWLNRGGAARVASSRYHRRKDKRVPAGAYTDNPDGIAQAILDCRDWYGRWPTEWEFYDWAGMRRDAARAGGQRLPHIPGRKPLHSAFAGWANAVTYAARNESRLRSPRAVRAVAA